jgi:YVTN family beta-propeller protein
VTVIDAATGRVVGDPIPLGSTTATGLVVSPDGRRLYTANSDSTLSVIDLQHNNTPVATQIPIGTITGPIAMAGPGPDIVITNDDAQIVYISDFAEKSVFILDPATNIVRSTSIAIDGSPVSLALSRDNRHLFVNSLQFQTDNPTANQPNLTIVDTETNTVAGTPISYGTVTQTLASNGTIFASPDGRYVYTETVAASATSVPSATIWKIDTINRTVQALVADAYPAGFILSPDGTKVYIPTLSVTGNQPQTSVVSINTANGAVLRNVTVDLGGPVTLAVSANGARLYLAEVTSTSNGDLSTAVGQLVVIDTATSNPVTPRKLVNPITLAVVTAIEQVNKVAQQLAQSITHYVQALLESIVGGGAGGGTGGGNGGGGSANPTPAYLQAAVDAIKQVAEIIATLRHDTDKYLGEALHVSENIAKSIRQFYDVITTAVNLVEGSYDLATNKHVLTGSLKLASGIAGGVAVGLPVFPPQLILVKAAFGVASGALGLVVIGLQVINPDL